MSWYSSGSGLIELQLTRAQAAQGSHQGACDADIAELRKLPRIARQLNAIPPNLVRKEIKEYGAWDETELTDHDANLSRLLWIACGDIMEGK